MINFINSHDEIYVRPKVSKQLHDTNELERINCLDEFTFLQLKNLGLKEIPKEIGSLTNLTELDLGYNSFTEFPLGVFKLTKLTHLYLDGSKITSLPRELSGLFHLTTIWLTDEKQTGHHIDIPHDIKQHSRIKIYYDEIRIPFY
jgi:Leucine-rich repeat (LRR) protein